MSEEGKMREEARDMPLGEEVMQEMDAINKGFLSYYEKDSSLERKDTTEIIVDFISKTKASLQKIVNAGEEAREKLFWILFNGSIQIYTYCRTLREGLHSQKAIEGLIYAVSILDGNLILMKAKYLDWRVRIYCELASAYEDLGAATAAKNVIAHAQKQVQYLKELEEQDPPVPESTAVAIVEAQRILNSLELKYGLQSGQLKPDAWKKKLAEYFENNKLALGHAIVESLGTSVRKAATLVGYKKDDIPSWKAEAVAAAIESLEADIDIVAKALQEQIEHREREQAKQEEIANAVAAAAKAKAEEEAAKLAEAKRELEEKAEEEKKGDKKEAKGKPKEKEKDKGKEKGKGKVEDEKDKIPTVDEIVQKYKELDNQMVKERVWKEASKNVPFEVHVELIKLCFQTEQWEKLDKLIESAYIRLRYRRVEVPYVTGVDVLASIQREPIIPNGYELLAGDLNSLHLKQELAKLRTTQQSQMLREDTKKEEKTEKKKTETKKKPEEKKKPPASKKEEKKKEEEKEPEKEMALESELAQIKHAYVRLIIEKNRNPTNAVCGLTVVFANPETGPQTVGKETAVVIPLQCQDEEIPKRLPFIVFKRTSNALKDEDEQLSLITDIKCLISRDPFLIPPVGYIKIPIDLRENQTELIGLGTQEFIFIAYKNEKDFRMAERDIEIIKNLLEIEKSYLQTDNEEYAKLSKGKKDLCLNYDLEQLTLLGNILRDAIMGPIGDMYLIERQDMLFDIISLLWRKYVSPVLKAIDYTDELEAQGELLDYLSGDIKTLAVDAIKAIGGVVLASHRILNKMRIIDPILYGEITMQAGEIQEKIQDYRTGIQVLRAGISKIVEYRESIMKVGADGSENWISPMYITCNNFVIDNIEKQIKKSIEDWTNKVQREERQKARKAEHKALYENDEADHEFTEIQRASKLEEKQESEQGNLDQDIQMQRKRYYTDLEGLLVSIHCDMLVCMYRMELKLGRHMEGVKNQTQKLLTEQGLEAPDITKGVSTGLKAKMSIGKGVTAKKIKGDQKYLEATLHEAGKLRIA